MTMPPRSAPPAPRAFFGEARGADELYKEGEELAQAGLLEQALAAYTAADAAAAAAGEPRVRANALRRAAFVHYRRHAYDAARELCRESRDIALAHAEFALAGEALNLMGVIGMSDSASDVTRETFVEALRIGGADPRLRGRIEQNLGILANIRGDLPGALVHYGRSLEAFRDAGEARWVALAYNNLGMVSADGGRWEDADRYYRQCLEAAEQLGDVYLRALALMNHTEVFLAWQQFEHARENAEAALVIFDQLGDKRHKSETYQVLGVVYRETGRAALAEARLTTAVALAAQAEAVLEEAEASRELALLRQQLGHNQDALRLLTTAHRLFKRLDARRDMVDVGAKVSSLEGTYLAVVRQWGQSIESADSYTHGHCERVAGYATAVARALGFGDTEITTIRLGAYLHDVGKVRVPHEILNKPGRLSDDELVVMQQHPVYGVELLAGIEFPWDIKPMIRGHHERYDGTGYPDRLAGDAVPLHAQVIGVADVWDALTTTRSYRGALPRDVAMAIMVSSRHHWRPDVFAAFEQAMRGE
jgi:putative nucleotidyltransferase with HDIG domain